MYAAAAAESNPMPANAGTNKLSEGKSGKASTIPTKAVNSNKATTLGFVS
ncbi:Putative uncharacterized protein [Moritella viscosa]|nr:Putative uncharacterized protein [Moritella viscosa]